MPTLATTPPWMTLTLRAAAIYNLLWGALIILLPRTTLSILGLTPEQLSTPAVPFWQCIGMIVGVYAVLYWIAAANPATHWAIVLVGLLGKVFGPIGFLDAALLRAEIPITFAWTLITNDLIWWAPFALILRHAWRVRKAARAAPYTQSDGPRPAEPDARSTP